MPRNIAAAFATSILFATAIAQAQAQEAEEAAPEPAVAEVAEATIIPSVEPAADAEAAPAEEFVEDEPAEEYEEEEDYGGESFCGGGEETVIDLAYYELEAGNVGRARRMMAEALRTGEVDRWQRPYALALLAEAQLRLRQYGLAVVNYRKALRLDPDSSDDVRVGLATALYLRGAQRAAHQAAIEARDAVCDDEYSDVACYSAQSVLARTTTDAAEREAATQALTTLREGRPQSVERFDEVDRRLERRRRPRTRGGES